MKLTTLVNPKSVPGYCNGTLYMRISSQTDWDPQAGWKLGSAYGSDLHETFNLTSNTSIMVQIIPLTEGIINPGSLRLKGNMAVTVNGTVVAATVGGG